MTTAIGFPPALRGQQIDSHRNSSRSPERNQVSKSVNLSPKPKRSPTRNNNRPSIIVGKFENLPWHMIAVGVLLNAEEENNEDDLYNKLNDSSSSVSITADANSLLGPNPECYLPDQSFYQQRQQQQQNSPSLSPLPKYQPQEKRRSSKSPLRQRQQQKVVITDNFSMVSSSTNTTARLSSTSSSLSPSSVAGGYNNAFVAPPSSSNSPLPRYQAQQRQQQSMLPPLPKYKPQEFAKGKKISLSPTAMKQNYQMRHKKQTKIGSGGSSVASSSSVVDDSSIASSLNNGAAIPPRISQLSVASSSSSSNEADLRQKLYEFTRVIEIKDNRYRMRKYKNTFVGCHAVDALIKNNVVSTRDDAVKLGRQLAQKFNLFKHVCDDHLFKDEYIFYRYSK